MRVFFAIALSPDTQERLAAVASSLDERAPGAPVTWVPAANQHLTVRFLGDVSDEQRAAVEETAREAASGLARFHLTLEGVGTFGGRTPRVIWVGVRPDAGHEALRAVHAALEPRLRALGFPPDDYVYSPHATLGRVRDRGDARRPARGKGRPTSKPAGGELDALVQAIADEKGEPLEVAVDRFVLYESRLHGSRHPEYVEVASFPLV